MIAFHCPSCAGQLQIEDELQGRKVECVHCGRQIEVPQPTTAASVASRGPHTGAPADVPTILAHESLASRLPLQEQPATLLPAQPSHQPGSPSSADETCAEDQGKGAWRQQRLAELTALLAPPQAPDELGRLGPYRILTVLGSGGMGVVFKAEDPQLRREIALKVILPSLGASDSARQRFMREARAAAALDHDHVVRIYQVGEDRGIPFMAMQFLHGEPLDKRLQGKARLPLNEVVRIGRETATGLAAAHKQGLVHRDVKPGNLWLEGEDGRVKVLDFGLARSTSDDTHLTQQGMIVGTPAFMAPEQASGKPVDARCDLFSLGCVLYRLCTGRLPFQGNNTLTIIAALALETPPPPVELNPEVPLALSQLIMRLLAKKPEDRPQSAEAVVAALRQIEQQPARGDGAAAAAPQLKHSSSRHLLAGGLVSVVLLAALALFAGRPLLRQITGQDEKNLPTPIQPGGQDAVVIPPPQDDKKTDSLLNKKQIPAKASLTLVIDVGGHIAPISKLLFTPRSKELLSISVDKTIRVWDTKNGQTLAVLRPPTRGQAGGNLLAAALSPDGRILAVGGTPYGMPGGPSSPIFLIDWQAGEVRAVLNHYIQAVGCLAFDATGQRLASGSDAGLAHIWNLKTRTIEREIRVGTGKVVDVIFAPDGKGLLSAAGREAGIWPVDSDKAPLILQTGQGFGALAWSPDGKIIAVAEGRNMLKLYNADGTPRPWVGNWDGNLGRHMDTIGLCFSGPDRLLTHRSDAWGTHVGFVELARKNALPAFSVPLLPFPLKLEPHGAPACAIAPQGDLMAVADAKCAIYLAPMDNLSAYRVLGETQGEMRQVAWASDGMSIAWQSPNVKAGTEVVYDRAFDLARLQLGPPTPGDFQVRVKDKEGELSAPALAGKLIPPNFGPIRLATFVGRDRLAIAGHVGNVRLVDLEPVRDNDFAKAQASGVPLAGHFGPVELSPSPDGKVLLTHDRGPLIFLWDVESKDKILSLFVRGTDWVAWTPAGYYAVSPGGEARLSWHIHKSLDGLGTLYPAEQYRKAYNRPDVIRRLLEAGSLARALDAADQARGK